MTNEKNAKQDFLNKISKNSMTFIDYIKENRLWESPLDIYGKLTKNKTKAPVEVIEPFDFNHLYKTIYDFWYDHLIQTNFEKESEEFQEIVSCFLHNDRYKKDNMSPLDCLNFIHGGYDKVLGGTNLRPGKAQSNNNYWPYSNMGVYPNFLHFFPFGRPENIDCRLYLNIEPKNIVKLAESILRKTKDKRILTYFKFWTNNTRNDSFLIYTNFDRASQIIEILKEIRKENPILFTGSENINPLLAPIDGFIGFGEEPEYKHSSFNLERAEAISEFFNDVINDEVVNQRKIIGNFNKLVEYKNVKYNLKEFLSMKISQNFVSNIEQKIQNANVNILPSHIKTIKEIESYKMFLNKIFLSCKNEPANWLKTQCDNLAGDYIDMLKLGKNKKTLSINVRTLRKELFNTDDASLDKEISSNGYLKFNVNLDINLQKGLFNIFGSDKVIESLITEEKIKPYLDKHHISSVCPYLNKESEIYVTQDTTEIN